MFLLFNFEKKYFEKENVSCEFVGHPLLEKKDNSKINIDQIIGKSRAIISIFPGSRVSEINNLTPILISFIKLMSQKYNDITFVFHSTNSHKQLILSYISKSKLKNCGVITDEKIKDHILQKSIFAISKSGTVSLEICNLKIPSVIIYKMGLINFLIIKMLVKTKYVNIINIAAGKEIIPELLQSNCNADNIYKYVNDYLDNPKKIEQQVNLTEAVLNNLRTKKPSSEITSESLNKFL